MGEAGVQDLEFRANYGVVVVTRISTTKRRARLQGSTYWSDRGFDLRGCAGALRNCSGSVRIAIPGSGRFKSFAENDLYIYFVF
jgi:hypothetical protein